MLSHGYKLSYKTYYAEDLNPGAPVVGTGFRGSGSESSTHDSESLGVMTLIHALEPERGSHGIYHSSVQ
jgi:hypothetical protein